MAYVLIAGVLQGALLWGLGGLVVLLLRPRSRPLDVVAVAPVVSIGVLYVVRSVWDLIGLGGPFALPTILTCVVVVGACALRLRWRDLDTSGWSTTSLLLPALVVLASILVGLWLFHAVERPPGWDAMNHAFLTRRAVDLGVLDSREVCVTGITEAKNACEYYPLAVNNLWGFGLSVGVPLRDSMLATIVLTGPAALATGMMALQRRLGFSVNLASLSAFAATALGPLWLINLTGRITAAAGIALIPGTALAIILVASQRLRWSAAAMAALALVGAAGAHTNDMLVAVALGTLCAVFLAPDLRRAAGPLVGRLAAIGALALLLMAPVLPLALRAAPERSVSHVEVVRGDVGDEVRHWFLDGPEMTPGTMDTGAWGAAGVALQVLAPLGLVAAVWYRPARAWAVLFLGVVAIGVIAQVADNGVLRLVTRPWYGDPARIAWPLALIRPALGAGAIGGALQLAARRPAWAPSMPRPARVYFASAGSAVLLVVMIATAGDGLRAGRATIEAYAPFTARESSADAYLKEHVPKGSVVLDDRHHDGSTWTYADSGVPVLFGLYPLSDESLRDYNDRLDLLRRVGNGDTSETTRQLLERYHVSHVLTRDTALIIDGANPLVSPDRLDANPMLDRVFTSPGATVYAVRDTGSFTNDKRIARQSLTPGATLATPDGAYFATWRDDGELLITSRDSDYRWSSVESGALPRAPEGMLYLTDDGELWLVAEDTDLLWRSNTYGQPGNVLSLEPNGQLVIKGPGGDVRWAANPPPEVASGGDGTRAAVSR